MYCDKDSNGRISIMEMTAEELETICRALSSLRVVSVYATDSESEFRIQYERAGAILHHIEKLE